MQVFMFLYKHTFIQNENSRISAQQFLRDLSRGVLSLLQNVLLSKEMSHFFLTTAATAFTGLDI